MKEKYIRADLFMHRIANEALFPPSELMMIKFALELEPSEDVNPVVHARWYFDPDKSIGCGIAVGGMFCSNCGGDCPTGSHPYRDFKYCPHCGAKMDKTEENKVTK